MTSIRSISDVIEDMLSSLEGDHVQIGAILESLHERGIGFVLFVLALPMALPIPVPPGINVLLATPLILLTGQQALGGRTVWLPLSIKRKTVSRSKINRIFRGALPWVRKIEVLIKPRLGFITRNAFSHLIGILGLLMALTICIPLPLTNTVPSFGIALMAVGVLMRDGLAILAGAVIGTAWVLTLWYVLIFLGTEGIDILKETIKSFF